jgi:hypothetical protein
MNDASYDIKDMLEAAGLGLVFKTNMFVAKEPTNPDNVVTIYTTSGFAPERTLDNGSWYYRSAVQIRVRNNGYSTGMALATNIMTSLHNRANTEWNDTLYTVIQAVGEPVPFAWDENNRTIIIINFNLQRR